MKPGRKVLLMAGLSLAFNSQAYADSPPEPANQLNQSLHPELEILAETVWVNVKNRAAVTKVLVVVKNPADSAVATGFHFPLMEKDALVDFGVSRIGRPIISKVSDSAPPLAALGTFAESSDSSSIDSQSALTRLAPGESASVMLVYQTAPGGGENQLRYVFPLKESFKTKSAIRSFAFYAEIEEKSRIMEVRTESYPIVVRGNGPKRQVYFYQNNLFPKADIGFSYRLEPKKPKGGP